MRLSTTHLAALGMLAAALIAGRAALVVVDVTHLPLAQIPEQLGPWTCIDQNWPEVRNTDDESVFLARVYENEDGMRLAAWFQVTASRLGALRNWAVGMMGNGWTMEEPWIGGPFEVEGLPFAMQLSLQWMHQPQRRALTGTWFVTPGDQEVAYDRVQMRGWREQLTGARTWGELHISTLYDRQDSDAEELEAAVVDLATRLAPHFHAALSGKLPTAGATDFTATDGGEFDGD